MRIVKGTIAVCITCLTAGLVSTSFGATSPGGDAFDAAPFGMIEGQPGKAYIVRWAEPRKVRTVVVEFDHDAPAAEKVKLQYWHGAWDGRPDPILAEGAAGGQGWTAMDDWTNGQWKDADARLKKEGERFAFTFAPTGEKEFKDLGHPGVSYRKTLKLRLSADGALPKIKLFQAITDAVSRPLSVRILFGKPAEPSIKIDGNDEGAIEVYNGSLESLVQTGANDSGPGRPVLKGQPQWTCSGDLGSIGVNLRMAVDPTDGRYDRTIVTVRSKYRPFSFAADEIARGDRILVDDLGALVVRGDDAITLEGYRQLRKEFPGKTIYDRVAAHGEQTLMGAWGDMPIRHPMAFVHGLPGDRNAMQQAPNGDLRITNSPHWFRPKTAKDAKRKTWDGQWLSVGFGFPDHVRGGRELRDGYLPQLRTWWQDGPIYYEQTTIMDKIEPDLSDVLLDDPTVVLMKIRVVNTSAAAAARASLHLSSHHDSGDKLTIDGDRGIGHAKGGPRFRFLIRTGGPGEFKPDGDIVHWSMELAPGQSHDLFVAVPSITLDTDEEIDALRKRDFDADCTRVCDFWKKQVERGTQIETPEPWLNGFYKSQLMHMMINSQRESGSQRLFPHVGTFSYGVYANESVMMVSDFDRRGYHDLAERCIDSWLEYQGSVMLNGTFKSKDGIFYGVNRHESGSYNKHHGYAMWSMAEHWRFTHDRKWMEHAAPKLVKGCDWIISERKATMTTNPDGSRAFEYGFLPAGGLEDVQDFWFWLGTNSATVWGFDAVAESLAEYGHPQADRLVKEAKAYHDDVARGFRDAAIRSPVVRLRDGTYVPEIPSEVYTRGRCFGWIRETLEGGIFMPIMGLIDPKSPEALWTMKDYEDNRYISERYGYSIPTFDRFWFSRGGFCMQAQLLDSPVPYIQRDEVKHFLRTYFNAFASAFEPEIRMCNEHSLPELGYPAGDMFKTSDEAQSTYWLRLMFVHEDGKQLYLSQAVPRYWLENGRSIGIERAATHFGPMSLHIVSHVDEGRIEAVFSPPERNRPEQIYLRLRHPKSKPIKSVTLNGKPHDKFDAAKEWVILPGTLEGKQEVVARY